MNHTSEQFAHAADFYERAPTGQYDEEAAHALRCHHELLAALNAVLPYAEETQDEGPDGYGWKSDDLRKALALARAAIAKVKQR